MTLPANANACYDPQSFNGIYREIFGVLIEHYAGAFPVWLAPVQVSVLPVAEEHETYAEQVERSLRDKGFRVELERASNSLGRKNPGCQISKDPLRLSSR